MSFHRWLELAKDVEPGKTLPAGMSRRGIVLGDSMLALHEAFPDLKCNPHTHASSQMTYVLKGKLRMRIGDEERVLLPGEFAFVPSNVEHSIESLDEYVVALDVFQPYRPDIAERLRELHAPNRPAGAAQGHEKQPSQQ
jgi:mannose-6-phosphate isomerase-like protein (cupin superfamily)